MLISNLSREKVVCIVALIFVSVALLCLSIKRQHEDDMSFLMERTGMRSVVGCKFAHDALSHVTHKYRRYTKDEMRNVEYMRLSEKMDAEESERLFKIAEENFHKECPQGYNTTSR